MMATDDIDRIVFLALGTRGDVQPAALLAAHIHQVGGGGEGRAPTRPAVVFITHATHHTWLAELLPALPLGLPGLPSTPGAMWHGTSGAAPAGDSAEAREAVIAAVCGAFGTPLIPNNGGPAAAPPPCPAELPLVRRLLVFNLFALEGYHLAEALGVPAVAFHPYPIPYACPASFEQRFAAAHPRLHAALKAADKDGSVGWGEVRHWMWPLFLERWQAWREERLGLPPVPLLGALGDGGLPPPVPLVYGFSERVAVLPGHVPPSVCASGFLLQAHARRCAVAPLPPSWQLPADLVALTQEACRRQVGGQVEPKKADDSSGGAPECQPLVLVDFGSMGALGLLPPAERLLAVLVRALELAELRGLLLGGGQEALRAAHAALPPQALARLHLYPSSLAAHDLLLSRCRAVLHHGGSGTVAAALAAGIPQVVVPLQFDQPFWAGRLEFLGLAGPSLNAAMLSGGDGGGAGISSSSSSLGPVCAGDALESAAAAVAARLVHAVSSPHVRQNCNEMAAALQAPDECGLDTAAALMLRYVRCSHPQDPG